MWHSATAAPPPRLSFARTVGSRRRAHPVRDFRSRLGERSLPSEIREDVDPLPIDLDPAVASDEAQPGMKHHLVVCFSRTPSGATSPGTSGPPSARGNGAPGHGGSRPAPAGLPIDQNHRLEKAARAPRDRPRYRRLTHAFTRSRSPLIKLAPEPLRRSRGNPATWSPSNSESCPPGAFERSRRAPEDLRATASGSSPGRTDPRRPNPSSKRSARVDPGPPPPGVIGLWESKSSGVVESAGGGLAG